MPTIEEMMTPEQVAKAMERIAEVSRETFVEVANLLTAAACTMQKIADETDGRRRLELLFEMNNAMSEMAAKLAYLDLGLREP